MYFAHHLQQLLWSGYWAHHEPQVYGVCMEFMRTNYPDVARVAKQHFGCTVVEEAEVEISDGGVSC